MVTKPSKQSLQLNRANYKVATLLSFAVLVFAIILALPGNFNGWELSLFRLFYNLPLGLKPLFLVITQLGSVWMVLILWGVALAGRIRGLAYKIFVNGAITYVAVEYLKTVVARPRPDYFLSITPRQPLESGNGFPSGHTALAAVLALTILPYLPKRYYWTVPVWILAVAISRLYLGVHAPLDVIGGAALGIFVASLWHVLSAERKGHTKPKTVR